MLRGMIFLDHMNFDIALCNYSKLVRLVAAKKDGTNFTKSYIFIPKPDDFLMKDTRLSGYYKWASGMANAKYIDIIEGRYIARPTGSKECMKIEDNSTFYKVEKGTDINLEINALAKGFFNSYDIAFVMSADTDYISLYRQLKAIGKIVIVVAVKEQNIGKIIPEVDDYIILDETFFNECIR